MSDQTSIADDFLYALRSGDYNQGVGVMYDPKDKCYCALGVLADLLQLKKNGHGKYTSFSFTSALNTLEDNFNVLGGKIVHMNDKQGASFSEIADYLEPFKKA